MAGPSWLIDSRRIATKIKSASERCDLQRLKWKSNPTRACPNCNHIIDNSGVNQEWPGLPRGVKFDPSDQEIIWHLLSKVGIGNAIPHPFIEDFIPTVDEDDGICYTHPQNLPGVKQDGSVSHFFHRAIKAYNTGTRKRRKIHATDLGDVRWHKTGRTKPVILDGIQRGCKKIMVLYMSKAKGGKPEKTNWVMHQYHLGVGEEENDGEFVVSKVFYQQQAKPGDKVEQDLPVDDEEAIVTKVDPGTPKSVICDPPLTGRKHSGTDHEHKPALCLMDAVQVWKHPVDGLNAHTTEDQEHTMIDYVDKQPMEHSNWGEGQSQDLLDSQQLVEGLFLCRELLQSQSPNRDGDDKERNIRLHLSDHDHHTTEDQEHTMMDDPENQNTNGSKAGEGHSQDLLDSQQLVERLFLCGDLLQSQSPNRDGYGKERRMRPHLSDRDHHTTDDHEHTMMDNPDNQIGEGSKVGEGESQDLLDSQQLVDKLFLRDGLQSQFPNRDGDGKERKTKLRVCDYNHHTTEDQEHTMMDDLDNQHVDVSKWGEGESQDLLDSQQLVEKLYLCDDLLQSQSPNRDGDGKERKTRPSLSDYAHIGLEIFKKDLEECQNLGLTDDIPNGGEEREGRPYHSENMSQLDHLNIELETPPDFRLSQLEFGSQDSFRGFGL